MQPAIAMAAASRRPLSPLLYGPNLAWFLDPSLGAIASGGNLVSWQGQVGGALLTVPAGTTAPLLIADAVNGYPGIGFAQLDQHLEVSSAVYDNFWAGPGLKRFSFGFIADQIANSQQPATGVIVDKGLAAGANGGWQYRVSEDGTGSLEFVVEFNDASRFVARANGVLAPGDRAVGWIDWDGTRSPLGFAMRLWDGQDFVGVGVQFSLPNVGAVIASDTGRKFSVGNNTIEPGSFNGNLEGSVLMLYATRPARTSIDNAFLRRFVSP
jgi:hypothetical protein